MFSPATRKSRLLHQQDKDRRNAAAAAAPDSPSTPSSSMIPNRPPTGTPAPWSSRLSVLARIPSANASEKGGGAAAHSAEQTQPVYVGEFPQVVRDAQTLLMQKSIPGIQVVVSLAHLASSKGVFVSNPKILGYGFHHGISNP